MRPELTAIASGQGGLFTRSQAVQAGYRERQLRTLTSVHGPWVAVRRGVYARRDTVTDASETPDGLAALRDRAAHLSMREAHVMSHDSAARAWGLPMLRPKRELVHITRKGVLGTRTEAGVKHHLTRFELVGCEQVDGLLVTGLARTAVDLAREHGLETAVVAIDAARRRGVSVADLESEVAAMRHWPGVAAARMGIDLSDPGAESPGESLTRMTVMEAGIGPICTQFPIRLPRTIAWVDLLVGRHVIEFDGRVKFRRTVDGGVATRPIEDVLWDERSRQNEISALGFGISRVTWDEVLGARRSETAKRIRREYEVTCSRLGTELSGAERRFVEQMAAERLRRCKR